MFDCCLDKLCEIKNKCCGCCEKEQYKYEKKQYKCDKEQYKCEEEQFYNLSIIEHEFDDFDLPDFTDDVNREGDYKEVSTRVKDIPAKRRMTTVKITSKEKKELDRTFGEEKIKKLKSYMPKEAEKKSEKINVTIKSSSLDDLRAKFHYKDNDMQCKTSSYHLKTGGSQRGLFGSRGLFSGLIEASDLSGGNKNNVTEEAYIIKNTQSRSQTLNQIFAKYGY